MNSFVQKHHSDVIGVLSGFDRLVIRGTVRPVSYTDGMTRFLSRQGILLKDFGNYAEATSNQVKQASLAIAERAGRPVQYLASPKVRKDERAREIAQHDAIDDGLICVFKAVEPFWGFSLHRNPEAKKLELRMEQRKCLHLHHYLQHPVFGFMHVRVQTWFPFQVQIWLNGREWLARTLDRKGITYQRRENCFPRIADVERAQHLMDEQLALCWPAALDLLRTKAHPAREQVFASYPLDYYWSVYQSEWATDVMFRDQRMLAELYQRLVHHGITRFECRDVLRFLGKKLSADGNPRGNFAGEVTSDLKHRPEGIRLKHYVAGNSVKIYDKQGTVLRIETTINEPHGFKVYRTAEGDDTGLPTWRAMRKGVADMTRRTEVSQAVNDRYLDALASCEDTTPLGELIADVCRPVTWKAGVPPGHQMISTCCAPSDAPTSLSTDFATPICAGRSTVPHSRTVWHAAGGPVRSRAGSDCYAPMAWSTSAASHTAMWSHPRDTASSPHCLPPITPTPNPSTNWQLKMISLEILCLPRRLRALVIQKTLNPDGRKYKADDYEFDFTLSGVRVPAIVISPYFKPATLLDDVMDHTSIMATLKDLFGSEPIGKRAAAANPFWRGDDETWAKDMLMSKPRTDLQEVHPLQPPPSKTGPPPPSRDSDLAVLHYLLARKVDLELQQGTGGLASLTALPADDLMRDQLPPAEKVKEVIARLEAARNLPSERMVKIVDFAGYTYTEWQNQPYEDEKLFDNIVALGPVELTVTSTVAWCSRSRPAPCCSPNPANPIESVRL